MKAVGLTSFGGPEVLRTFSLAEPHAGPGEVRIRVHAATVNPGDTLLRSGMIDLGAVEPPHIPGMEAAGVLDEIGEGADTDLRLGDHVMAMVMPIRPEGGAYAEYLVLPVSSVAPAPAGAGHVRAATLPMNGLTARLALDRLDLAPGRTLAVTGAAGVVGGYVVQLAKADGLHVVADAAPADEELVRSLSADVVVPRGDDIADRILDAVPGGVDGIVDAALIGSARLAPAIGDGGGVAVLRDEDSRAVSPAELRRRSLSYRVIYVPDYVSDRARLNTLRRQAESGVLTLRVARTLPAARAAEAHRLLEAGGTRGRIVLEF
ncbi:NADP-dependent oxidoreductase [Streptomyces sp. NPDC094472]|uniref:NADP-dependent oxidoreductase n=1 Tax=unclassified Streptomyces TaxID=2593676 RepID=UPI0033239C56